MLGRRVFRSNWPIPAPFATRMTCAAMHPQHEPSAKSSLDELRPALNSLVNQGPCQSAVGFDLATAKLQTCNMRCGHTSECKVQKRAKKPVSSLNKTYRGNMTMSSAKVIVQKRQRRKCMALIGDGGGHPTRAAADEVWGWRRCGREEDNCKTKKRNNRKWRRR